MNRINRLMTLTDKTYALINVHMTVNQDNKSKPEKGKRSCETLERTFEK